MQVIEVVSIDDVYPVEDEYGNQYLSRDYSTKENRAYVEALARSMAKKGVPDELVTLVRDGGIYRVKAGNSRVMAMRQLGTKTFPAVIDEDDTPEALIEAAIRTDEKKAYEPVEKSRLVQQLALIASDEYVSEAVGIEPEKVAKVRRARRLVDDAADDMSLLRLIAIADFEDDPDAVELLTTCSERDFPEVERLERDRRARRERLAALCAALEARGVPLADSGDGLRFMCSVESASDIPDELPDGCVAVPKRWGDGFELRCPVEEEVDPTLEAERARMAELRRLWEATKEHREAWLDGTIAEGLGAVAALADDGPYSYCVSSYIERRGLVLPKGPADVINGYLSHARQPYDWEGKAMDDRLGEFADLGEALASCGYVACDEEIALIAMLEEAGDE